MSTAPFGSITARKNMSNLVPTGLHPLEGGSDPPPPAPTPRRRAAGPTLGRLAGGTRTVAGRNSFERPKDEAPFRLPNLHQLVAFQAVGLVRLGHDPGRRPVQGTTGGPTRLLPALPEAERQALAPLIHNPPEVAKKAAHVEGLGVSSSVVLPQELQVRRHS